MSNKLGIGDKFPSMTINLVNGGTINLPESLDSKYGVILFYRGHWFFEVVAFFVEDLDKFYEDTSQKGIKYNNPPASMFDDNGKLSRKAAYAQDPDGNWLEFVESF